MTRFTLNVKTENLLGIVLFLLSGGQSNVKNNKQPADNVNTASLYVKYTNTVSVSVQRTATQGRINPGSGTSYTGPY